VISVVGASKIETRKKENRGGRRKIGAEEGKKKEK
jgi:hypothetical protein